MVGKGIRIHFRGVKAVENVDIELHPGEVLGLIGPNGAGKTTLLNGLSGFVSLTSGQVRIGDTVVTNWPPNQLAKMGLSRTFQSVRLFRGMLARENVEVAGLGIGLSPREARGQADALLERLGLADRSELPANALSFGEEQRLSIARALATRPKFLLLDEPAAGLNESEGDALANLIAEVRRARSCGVFFIEHDMRLVFKLCDRIQVLNEGETISVGSPEEIVRDEAVINAYLGTRKFRSLTHAATAPPPQ